MKKIELICLVLGLILISGGCGDKNQEPASSDSLPETSSQQSSKNDSGSDSEDLTSLLSSGDQKVRCEFDITEGGNQQSGVFWLGKTGLRAEYQVADQVFTVVSKEDTSYYWGKGLEAAFKISSDCQTQLETENSPEREGEQEDPLVREPKDFQSWAENSPVGVNCQEYKGEINLEVPSDIQFFDQCEFLEQQREMYKNIPNLEGLN